MSEPQPRNLSPVPSSVVGIALAALVVEAGLVIAAAFLLAPIVVLLVLHALVVFALILRVRAGMRRGEDVGTAVVLCIAVAIAGPFGAVGGACLDWLSAQGQEHRDRLARWYARISLSIESDEVTQLSDNIVIGRSMDLGAPPPQSFSRIIEHGSIGDKQAVLGLVARRFHPHYLPTLKRALLSSEPVIRVQAAAVAARVRGPLTEDVRRQVETLAALPPGAEALRLSREIELSAASGLVEDLQSDAAMAAASKAREMSLTAIEGEASQVLKGTGRKGLHSLADAIVRRDLEAKLLAEGRYGEFRTLRRAFAFPTMGRLRLRALGKPTRRYRRLALVGGGRTA